MHSQPTKVYRALAVLCLVPALAGCYSTAQSADERMVLAAAPAASKKTAMKAAPGAEQTDDQTQHDTEQYDAIEEHPFLAAVRNPLSTFSIDVDTASYANVRRFLESDRVPPAGAVRIEELVNYFSYDYPQPTGDAPFALSTEVAGCPWAPQHRLVRIGIQGRRLKQGQTPPRNLVFLLDVSGSMNAPDKLPLVKKALGMLTGQLTAQDRVAIVVYAGASGLALPPTSGNDKGAITAALSQLSAGGSTNGGAGIQLAYATAREHFDPQGINRVILCTDGDFNVGTSSRDALVRLIETERDSGVFLTVLGVGTGNLKDSQMEELADKGNGNYAYIDGVREARKVLVEQVGGTLVTIAKDVKIQVEFNPSQVAAYRLIGYENRLLAAEDFTDDTKDAGEIGAGHSVTALYEVVPVGVPIDLPAQPPLKYSTPGEPTGDSDELLTVKVRYKAPQGTTSQELQTAVSDDTRAPGAASADFRFAAAVAGFGMLLRKSPHKGNLSWSLVRELSANQPRDPHGHRKAFGELIGAAERVTGQQQ